MFRRTIAAAVAGAIILAILPFDKAAAAIPGHDNPKAFTINQLFPLLLDWNRRTLAGAYTTAGSRNPRWDAPAEAFLEAMARFFSVNAFGTSEYRVYPIMERPSLDHLEQLATRALNVGCDDGLVLYCYQVVLNDKNDPDANLDMARRVYEALRDSAYPALRKGPAARQLLERLNRQNDAQEYEQVEQALRRWFIESLSAPVANPIELRFLANLWDPEPMRLPAATAMQWLDELTAKGGADPWLMAFLRGRQHRRLAWEGRGSGWADTVTDEGWRKFFDQLGQARAQLVKAYELRPDFPEAASEMITVAMGSEGILAADTPRLWFDRAVSAQLDHAPAYVRLRWALRPRWGGSHDEMYALAMECAQTERYDTAVPWEVLRVLADITSEADAFDYYWGRRGVYDTAAAVMSEYARRLPPERSAWLRSFHAAAAAHLGRWDDARRLCDDLGDKLDMTNLAATGGFAPRVLSQIYAMSGPHGAAAAAAARQAAMGNWEAAAKAYRQIASQVPADDKASSFFRGRAVEVELEGRFQSGEWVELKPNAALDGWYVVTGEWKFADNGIEAHPDDNNELFLLCLADFGRRFEAQVTVDLLNETAPTPRSGILLSFKHPEELRAALLTRAAQRLDLVWSRRMAHTIPIKVPVRNDLLVQFFDTQATVHVNGVNVIRNRSMNPRLPVLIGLGGQWGWEGGWVRFSNFRIRKLDNPPGAPPRRDEPPAPPGVI